jgi:hypothetical protein
VIARTALIVAAIALVACHGEEGRLRKRIAADYVSEIDERGFQHRDVLTIHADGRWRRTTTGRTADRQFAGSDSGRYRIQDHLLILRSTANGGALVRYRINGDTLHGANAVEVARVTGIDIGREGFLVRAP